MKEPIEELFKQSLGGHEMPYNPDAWTAMNARLDVVSPVTTPTSNLKYYFGAAGIGAAAVATYFFFAAGNSTDVVPTNLANENIQENTTTPTNTPTTGISETQSGNTSVISNPSETPISTDKRLQNTGSSGAHEKNGVVELVTPPDGKIGDAIKIRTIVYDGTGDTPYGTPSNGGSSHAVHREQEKLSFPIFNDVCLGDEITITNPNNTELYVLDGLNQQLQVIPGKGTIVFKATQVGNYNIGYKFHGDMETASHFQVNRVPDADFMIDLVNKFENGLPSTHVEAISGQGTYTWKAENQSATGTDADLHFYKSGNQTIELTVNNGQCATTVEKSIYIEKDYNLMAVTGFTPLSNLPENSTFMPFGLTQREVNFNLTIIDGRDGGVVYETSDATLPWDGTDMRSGKRSPSPQVYVWKVVILNPATNEPTEYRGTITMN